MGKISTALIIIIVIIILILFGVWIWYAYYGGNSLPGTTQSPNLVATDQYYCDQGKTIDAVYYEGTSTPVVQPGQPPQPNGSVALDLSDGRELTFHQTISGSGIRYANSDESIIFFSEGNGALLLENNQQTYTGCIIVAPNPDGLPGVFESGSEGFSIRYPAGYTINPDYRYSELGPNNLISGVSFTIPESFATGTNLAPDTYLGIEEIPQTTDCTASLFLSAGALGTPTPETITDEDVEYSFASSTGAGAGNRYEEWVFAIPGTNPCIGMRYFIHYGVIENYPAGTVSQFDEPQLLEQFDAMRHTLVLQQLGI